MAEIAVIESWLASTLGGDATLTGLLAGGGVYNGKLPATQGKASIVFDYVDDQDAQNSSADIIFADAVYLVKVVAPGESPAPAVPLMARVHTLIHKGSGAGIGGRVLSCTRLGGVRYVDDAGFIHYGARYRIIAQLD